MRILYKFLSLLLPLILVYSCLSDEYDLDKISGRIEYDPAFVLPAVKGELTLANSVEEKEDTLFFDDEGILKLMFKIDSLFSYEISEFIDLEDMDPEPTDAAIFGSLRIADFEANDQLRFDELGPTPAKHDLNPFTAFEQVFVDSGLISVEISNNLTVSLDITIRLNQTAGQIGGDLAFLSIPAGGSQVQSTRVSGDLNNDWDYDIISYSAAGANNSDLIDLRFYSEYIFSFYGRAKLVDQVFFSEWDTLELEAEEVDQEVTIVEFLGGDVNYHFTSSLEEDAIVHMILPTGSINGDTLKYEVPAPAGQDVIGSADMSGASFDLAFDPEQAFNKLPLMFEAEIIASGNIVDFDPVQVLAREYWMGGMQVAYVEGYLGHDSIEIDQYTIDMDLGEINNRISGTLTLTDPSIRVYYMNSVGVPVTIDVDIEAIDDKGVSLPLGAPDMDVAFPVSRDDPAVESSLVMDRDNTSIVDMIAMRPEKIIIGGRAIMNPQGNTGERDNWVESSSSVIANLELEIPASFHTSDLRLKDTLDNPFYIEPGEDEGSVLENFDELELYLLAENGFPLEVGFTITAYDSIADISYGSIVIDELFPAAPVDASGRVTDVVVSEKPLEIILEKSLLEELQNSNKLIIDAGFISSPNGETGVTLYSDYTFAFRLAVRTRLNLNL